MKIILMLGGNIGDSAAVFREACRKLTAGGVRNIRMSSIFRSAAVDCVPGTPDFCDAAISAEWDRSPLELLKLCQETERAAGRPANHSSRESRILDVDIILFGNEIINIPELTIPHPRAISREFVLAPLCQIEPQILFPNTNLTAEQLLKNI